MNKLSTEEKVRVVSCLVEGNSLRSTSRMTGIHRTTIQNLLVDLGKTCSEYQDRVFRNLKLTRIQCDEIWSFVGCKEKRADSERKAQGWGDAWTWTSLDAQTKLVPCWLVGQRDALCAYHFVHDLKSRLAGRVQLTTDDLRLYLDPVEHAFGADVDYAQLVKIYGNAPAQVMALEANPSEVRYSPPVCMGDTQRRDHREARVRPHFD